jgi:hypothetical protein
MTLSKKTVIIMILSIMTVFVLSVIMLIVIMTLSKGSQHNDTQQRQSAY